LIKFFIILSKNIYGVDINPSALKIAKARLFLTLAKHFKVGKEKDIFIRFPNVHFNLRDGNSLIGYVDIGKEQKKEQLQLRLFVEEKQSEYITEKIKVVSELKPYLEKTAKCLNLDGNIIEEVKELNKILAKRKIDWNDFKKVLRTKEKLITILIASLNSKYARPLNNLLREITDLFNQKLDEKFAEEHGIDLEDLKKIKTFHWIFEFPEVFLDRGGFDVVVGNPPYGFRRALSKFEKAFLRKIGFQFPSGDMADVFTRRSLFFTKKEGRFSFIIPKKSIYGDSWSNLRKFLRTYYLASIADTGKAFEEVKLEMTIFVLKKVKNRNLKLKAAYYSREKSLIEMMGEFIDSMDHEEPFYIYSTGVLKEIYESIKHFPKIGEMDLTIKIGQGNVTSFMKSERIHPMDIPILKGDDISRYNVRNIHYLPFSKIEHDYLKPKLVFQKIIAHIQNPIPHIKIMGVFDPIGVFTLHDTAVMYHTQDKLLLASLLGLLNSKFASWFYYNYTYNRAIRTMDFIDYYAKQLPIPKELTKNSIVANLALYLSVISQRNQESQKTFLNYLLDSLVCELYFKEKFYKDSLYPEPKEYLLEEVSKHLKPINYDCWAELYWKKQLEGNLTEGEQKELEKLEKENMKTIEGVYKSLKEDAKIKELIEKIKSHEWVKVIEGKG
ncbi:MAG TPA: hypothetical protein ENG50_01970, partial [Candidatus Altiarchaeales archaeon]|nr:hypothetical protein [Candidatus Altiarchaeales archaeon]